MILKKVLDIIKEKGNFLEDEKRILNALYSFGNYDLDDVVKYFNIIIQACENLKDDGIIALKNVLKEINRIKEFIDEERNI